MCSACSRCGANWCRSAGEVVGNFYATPVPNGPWAQGGPPAAWHWGRQPAPPVPEPEPEPQEVHHPKTRSDADMPAVKADYLRRQAEYRYEMAMDALRRTSGNKKKAAELMGISRRGFYRILEQKRAQTPTASEIPTSGDLDH